MVEDSGSDLLLFVALQVSSERTSSRPKFFITISLRVTPLRTFIVLLFMKLLLRYQVTVGGGLPAKETDHRDSIRSNRRRYNISFLPRCRLRIYFYFSSLLTRAYPYLRVFDCISQLLKRSLLTAIHVAVEPQGVALGVRSGRFVPSDASFVDDHDPVRWNCKVTDTKT